MEIVLKEEIGGKPLSIRTGKVARQASGSVVVQYGDTVVLVTVVSTHDLRASDFLPLTVEYQEKIYAAGRIPGNYFRREIGRPSEKETLTARLIDRPIRPLFPKDYRCEIQVIATVLSMDQENDADTLAMIGASTAIHLSDIPFAAPIAAVRVGRVDGELRINPPIQDWERCDINIIVAGSKNGVVMVEGGADIVSEADMTEAIFFGHRAMQPLIELQEKLRETHGAPKREFVSKQTDPALAERVTAVAEAPVRQALLVPEKVKRQVAVRAAKSAIFETLGEEYAERRSEVLEVLDGLKRRILRELILDESRRLDGRKFDEVRPIACEVAVLPRPHGSALFTRGETQVLGVLTLGSGQDEQRVETLSGEEMRPFMLHYNFPPYSVGEAKRISGPSRRDIGHGGLSTRAIAKILPQKETFDYTIRLVSEVLESNGSSSMGTVCACCLALMDGGVPIKAPVAGIAMGLVQEKERTVVLSDILGDEDHAGDMDFKVAGTREGISALQMDIKIHSLSREVLEQALEQARQGRLHILEQDARGPSRAAQGDLPPRADHHHHHHSPRQDPRGDRPGRQGHPRHSKPDQHHHLGRGLGSGESRRLLQAGSRCGPRVHPADHGRPRGGGHLRGHRGQDHGFRGLRQHPAGHRRAGAHLPARQPPGDQGQRRGQRGRQAQGQGPRSRP